MAITTSKVRLTFRGNVTEVFVPWHRDEKKQHKAYIEALSTAFLAAAVAARLNLPELAEAMNTQVEEMLVEKEFEEESEEDFEQATLDEFDALGVCSLCDVEFTEDENLNLICGCDS